MILVFAEFLDELQVLARNGVFRQESVLVSPSPKVQYEAGKNGIPIVSIREYFGRESHERIVLAKQAFYSELKRASGDIIDSFGVRDAYSSTYFFILRYFVTHLMSLAELLENVIQSLAPEEVYAVRLSERLYSDTMEGRSTLREGDYPIFRYERYGADILERLCKKHRIRSHVLTLEVRPPRVNRKNSALRMLARVLSPLILRRLEQVGRELKKSGRKAMLATSPAYRLDELIEEFVHTSSGWTPFMLGGARQSLADLVRFFLPGMERGKKAFIPTWHSLLSLPPCGSDPLFEESSSRFFSNIRKALSREEVVWGHRGVDLSDLVLGRTTQYLSQFVRGIHWSVAALNRLLDRIEPSIVVSQMSLGPTAALGELAGVKGIPSLLISHGSHVPMKNIYEGIVWKNHAGQLINTNYNHIAVQTPWAEKFLRQMQVESKAYKTGPLLFSCLNGALHRSQSLRLEFASNREKIILHASTPKTRSGARMYVYETEEEYIQNLADLVAAVESVPGYALVIRFRPTQDLSVQDLQGLLPSSSRVYIRSDGLFQDYLATSDILVSFSSTAIEEALLSHKPVIQYDPTGRYCHIPAPAFDPKTSQPSAVYFVDRKEHLAPILRWVLLNHFPKQKDTWFAGHQFKAEETIGFGQVVEDICRFQSLNERDLLSANIEK